MTGQGHSAAYSRPCRYCSQLVLLARGITGRWRVFDPEPVEAGPDVFRYRRGVGMVEAPGVPGFRLHACVEQSSLGDVAHDVIDDLRRG